MTEVDRYTSSWYRGMTRPAERSANVIVPLVVGALAPSSVVDIGCASGAWLKVFTEHGVSDIQGVDGATVPGDLLVIPTDRFRAVDLSRDDIDLGRTFDLAVSVEVAEHLPAARAQAFVDLLVTLAPVVLFGAAIPAQGGTGHVNEQWADYWATMFAAHDYVMVDFLRPRLWGDPRVEYWYAQNTFLYVRRDQVRRLGLEADVVGADPVFPLRSVHPGLLDAYAAENAALMATASSAAHPGGLRTAVRERLRTIRLP